uniref:hypothetical protein n=1 Tax=uncultured Draconibacterium sp. TaxID=1573823 RepID=UPI0032175DAA
MKRIPFLLFILVFIIFSCDKIEDANTIDFDTSISIDIPVAVLNPAALTTKSATADYSFSASQTMKLSEIGEIGDYLNKLKSIDIENPEVTFSNLAEGEEIKTIEISVTGVGVLATFSNITNANATHTPSIDNALLTQVATILYATKEVTVTVAGTTNTAPMDFTINMDFDVHIEAEVL